MKIKKKFLNLAKKYFKAIDKSEFFDLPVVRIEQKPIFDLAMQEYKKLEIAGLFDKEMAKNKIFWFKIAVRSKNNKIIYFYNREAELLNRFLMEHCLKRGFKYTTEIKATSQREAMEIFSEKYPNGKILNIQKL